MRETLKIVNQMVKDGVIEEYAIGGAVAAIYYLALTTVWTFIQAYLENRLTRQLGIEQPISVTQRLLGARRVTPALQPTA